MRTLQQPLFTPETDWVPPERLPDLSSHSEIAIDLETRDPNLLTMGSGAVRRDGEIVGIAVAVEGWSGYFSDSARRRGQHGPRIGVGLV